MMPARKAGTATPSWDSAESSTPLTRRCRTAASVPKGTAMTSARIIAQTTSHRVTWSRSMSCGAIAARDT